MPRIHMLLSLLLLLPATFAQAGELRIEAQLAHDGALELRYTPPAGIRELPFWNASPDAGKRWRDGLFQAADDCTEVTGTGLRLRASPACTAATIRIVPRELALDAVYEPAQPISDGSGVLLYVGHYAVLLPGHALRWQWRAPSNGYVIHRGRVRRSTVEQFASAAVVNRALAQPDEAAERDLGTHQMVFIGRTPFESFAQGVLVVDPHLDVPRAARVRATLSNAVDSLTRAYGRKLDGRFAVVAALSSQPGFHGDTADGQAMRLRLPEDASTMGDNELEMLVSHEAAHWWNAGVYASDSARPWLHEGNAEWVARLLMLRSGAMTLEELRLDLERAMNRCLQIRGGKPAVDMPPGRQGDDPYACGMSLMSIAHAQRLRSGADGADTDPLRLIAGLYRRQTLLDAAGFADWADGGRAGAMTHLLSDPGVGFADGLMALSTTLELADAEPLTAQTDLPQASRTQLASGLVSVLMAHDCGGDVSFWRQSDGFAIDPDLRCRTLRGGDVVQAVAGITLSASPVAAWQAATSACETRGEVEVTSAGGHAVRLQCPKPMPSMPIALWLRLRPDALAHLGLRSAE